MKKLLRALLITSIGSVGIHGDTHMKSLGPAPSTIETCHEIAVVANEQLPDLFNSLTPQERIFCFYLMRASLPGHRILVDQLHCNGQKTIDLFEMILKNEKDTCDIVGDNGERFIEQAKIFATYLWTNHGQYFAREFSDEKRTPDRLGLDLLTEKELFNIAQQFCSEEGISLIAAHAPSIFDASFEPTNTVPDSIEKSSVNIYAQDFTDEDFEKLPTEDRTKINAHFSRNGVETYKIGGRLSQEMETAYYWLEKAHELALQHPETFDHYIALSLEHLLDFIKTGDEESFKKHSSAWLKTNSRIDYTFGFIETYKDPKGYRGMFESEVSIKSLDIQKLNELLPSLEVNLPFPKEYQRENLDDSSALPNASINTQVFGSGEFGPMCVVAAYCLPNYNEIRSQEGSKQIIYHTQKGLGARINPELFRQLTYLKDESDWLAKHDPDGKLYRDLWTLHVILHETLGHGSGKLGHYTDPYTKEKTPVTSENLPKLLRGYEATLEELRAEIIALHSSIDGYETLQKSGFLYDWPEVMGKDMLIDSLIKEMAQTGLRRLLTQQDGAAEIAGDHARANTTILNYLIDGGGIAIKEETLTVDSTKHTVLGIEVIDQEQARKTIEELVIKVQTIKSTGDGDAAQKLIDFYGKTVRNPEYIAIMKANHEAVVGKLKATAQLYPIMSPIIEKDGTISDIRTQWPRNIIEQQLWWSQNALMRF